MLLVCRAPLTLAVITMRGLTFHPCAIFAFINELYLLRNPSCVKVNSMIWMVKPCVFVIIAFGSYVASFMYNLIPNLSAARGSHRVVLHVQLNIHDGTVLSCGCHVGCRH